MTLRFVLPAIHRRPTGGNLYNRRMAGALRRLPPPAGSVTLIDSLMLGAPVRGRAVLLAHYLNLIDPERRNSRAADRERRLLAAFDGIVATSDFSRNALRAEGFTNVETVPPGLDERFRAALPARPSGRLLLTIASILPNKGLMEVIDVLESLADLEWTWVLAGDASLDPSYAGRVAARMARSPLRDRLRLRPPLPPSRIPALCDRAGVFVLPTHFETCSMVTREAMARGLPVVAYDTGGLAANLPAASRKWLAPPGDAAGLGARLRVLLTSAKERRAAGSRNRTAALRFPSWTDSAERLLRFLQRVGAT